MDKLKPTRDRHVVIRETDRVIGLLLGPEESDTTPGWVIHGELGIVYKTARDAMRELAFRYGLGD